MGRRHTSEWNTTTIRKCLESMIDQIHRAIFVLYKSRTVGGTLQPDLINISQGVPGSHREQR
eukprot:5401144-Amphidinium_carterae.3